MLSTNPRYRGNFIPMSHYDNDPSIQTSILGKTTEYPTQYDASLLHPIPRQLNRDQLRVHSPVNFHGMDIWYGYEMSWLTSKGKPVVAVAKFTFSAASEFLIESKSFKLYLNSFNQSRFDSDNAVIERLSADLSQASGQPVTVELISPHNTAQLHAQSLQGVCIDDQDIEIDNYQLTPELLAKAADHQQVTQETLHSHLLKSNCLITSQPDWGSVVIDYTGPAINKEALLRYLISFRQHNEFHEQCIERIYDDIWHFCQPKQLTVFACYTRRGGLDISPYRSSNSELPTSLPRTNRQ